MERVKFKQKISKALKIFAIVFAVLLTLAVVVGSVYLKYGLSGFAGFLGLDKQISISMKGIEEVEIGDINNKLGYDPQNADLEGMSDRRALLLELSPEMTAKIIGDFAIDSDMLKNLQIGVTDKGNLEVSTVANLDKVLTALGESRDNIEGNIGKLPDNVAVYAEIRKDKDSENPKIVGVKIGGIPVPEALSAQVEPFINEGINSFFDAATYIDLNELYVKDGKVVIDAKFPAP